MKFLEMLGLALTLALNSTPAARSDALTTISEAPSVDARVEGLMSDIRASKSLPGWAVDAAMNAYAVYKTYRNGEKVEEIGATVLAVLKQVADIQAAAEKGREMSEREYRLTHELLDSYGDRLEGYDKRLKSLESETKAIRAQLALWCHRRSIAARTRRSGVGLGLLDFFPVEKPRRQSQTIGTRVGRDAP